MSFSESLLPEIAMSKAKKAFESWRFMPLKHRVQLMTQLKNVIVEQMDECLSVIGQDVGKPPVDILTGDIIVSLEIIRYYEKNACAQLKSRKFKPTSVLFWGTQSYLEYAPYGTVLVLGPWNYPFQLALVPVLSALLAGNCVILKASECAPLTGALLQRLFLEAGFPPDVFQVVQGDGQVGADLVNLGPDKIFVTGSTATGKKVLRAASEKLIPVSLELGGKDAMIVLEDAALERTVAGAVFGAFSNAGQVCVSSKRIFVHEKIYPEFLTQFKAAAAKLRIGSDENSDIGPLVREEDVTRIRSITKAAVLAGARLESDGKIDGQKVWPVILSNAPEHCFNGEDEIFGPLTFIQPYSELSKVVDLVNASPFGLGASIWSRDLDRARRLASQLVVGTVDINDVIKNIGQPGVPFGGEKWSGQGRYRGEQGLHTFSRQRVVHFRKLKPSVAFDGFPYSGKVLGFLKKVARFRYGAKKIARFLSACALGIFLSVNEVKLASASAQLRVHVQGVPSTDGHLAYALFNSSAGFPSQKEQSFRKGFVEVPHTLNVDFLIEGLPEGTYALAVYHDHNDNHQLDKNFLGIPRESIGHSQNPRVRFGPPKFKETQFELKNGVTDLDVTMLHK